jgi:hypothetical protein
MKLNINRILFMSNSVNSNLKNNLQSTGYMFMLFSFLKNGVNITKRNFMKSAYQIFHVIFQLVSGDT